MSVCRVVPAVASKLRIRHSVCTTRCPLEGLGFGLLTSPLILQQVCSSAKRDGKLRLDLKTDANEMNRVHDQWRGSRRLMLSIQESQCFWFIRFKWWVTLHYLLLTRSGEGECLSRYHWLFSRTGASSLISRNIEIGRTVKHEGVGVWLFGCQICSSLYDLSGNYKTNCRYNDFRIEPPY